MLGGITGFGSGFDNYVMQGDYEANLVITAFEEFIKQGCHPNDVEQEVYRITKVNPANLSEWEKQRIQRRVEEIYQAHN